MVKIDIEGKKYFMPTSFEELPLGVYQEIAGGLSDEKTDIEKLLIIISKLTGIDESVLRNIDIKQFNLLCEKSGFIFKQDPQKELEIKYEIEVNGVSYGFDTLFKMNTAEFIDLEKLTKDPKKVNENLHLVMAILYRPIKSKKVENWFKWILRIIWNYIKLNRKFPERIRSIEIEEYDSKTLLSRAEDFKRYMMMDLVFTPVFFFTSLRTILIKNTVDSLDNPLVKKLMEMFGKLIQKKYLKGSGDGF